MTNQPHRFQPIEANPELSCKVCGFGIRDHFNKQPRRRSDMDKQKAIEVLDMIIADCKQGVKDFDGRVFDGKTLGELHGITDGELHGIMDGVFHGIIEARIEALAEITKELVKENYER